MSRRSTIAAISLALVLGLSPGALAHDGYSGTGHVSTATVPDLASVKAYATFSLQARLAKLDRLQAQVDGAAHLAAAHEIALEAQITAFRTGLNTALSNVQGATTVEQVRALLALAKTNFPVSQFLAPMVSLVIGADNVIFAAEQMLAGNPVSLHETLGFGFWMGPDVTWGPFSGFEGKLPDLWSALPVQGAPTADVATLLSQAKARANEVLAALLPNPPLTPTTANLSQVLSEARADLRAARKLLMQASFASFATIWEHPNAGVWEKPNGVLEHNPLDAVVVPDKQFGNWGQFGGSFEGTGSMFGSGFGGSFGGGGFGGDSWSWGQSGWSDGK
jgi:hypothetical protein